MAVEQSVASEAATQKHHRIEVSFEDEHALDLRDFQAHVHATREEFLQRLRSIRLSVRYLGFRAGFAYLDGWPTEWSMPRRSTSRNRVPGGSFGVAGAMAGFYPVDSPGGWNILGLTAAPLWDPMREPPNLFAPGDEIEIVPTINVEPPLRRFEPAESRLYVPSWAIADVVTPGQLTTIVGPPDWTRLEHGLSPGGAFDEEAAAMANAAVGNPPSAPLLECVLVGPKLRLRKQCRIAFCDGELNVRETLDIGRIRGMRGYLAIEGGIDEQRLRYSEAPTVVKRGDSLFPPPIHPPGTFSSQAGRRLSGKTIRVMRGPHDVPEEWEVTPQMNRVGIRLRPLETIDVKLPADLPSCGAQFGTLQWHADGTVMALGPDHPVPAATCSRPR
jgi:hypothetical protein